MGELIFRVLGPVAAIRVARPVALGGKPSVNLLAGLLLGASEPVSYDRLRDIVWGDRVPLHPQAALQSLTSRLRRALGGRAIRNVAGGYQITAADDALDLRQFERLVRAADSALGEGSADRAAALMDQALRLWNLPVLANVSSDVLLRDGVGLLMEQYLSAQQKRAVLQLRLGRYPAMIAELGRLVAAHPLREDLVRLLMLALYHSHRQAEALVAYQQLRQELRESLGIDPSESLQRLHLGILRGDVRPDQPGSAMWPGRPGAGAPGQLTARRSAHTGIRETRAAISVASERPTSAEHMPRQLPPDTGDFTGRSSEQSAILGALGTTAVSGTVVLAGPGGIGKSTLAVHAGHLLADAFCGGQVYLDAGSPGTRPRDPADLLAELLRALEIVGPLRPGTVHEQVGRYRSLVASRRFLLILDNVATEAQVRDLLPPGAGCGVVVCARRRLAGFSGARLIDLGGLAESEAVALLSQIIGAARLSREPGAASELIRLCGGLPLALRAVGARLAAKPHWRLATLARRMGDQQDVLAELSYGDLDVRAAISTSCAALPPGALEMLHKLAVIEAPYVPLWAAAALVDGRCADAEELCEALVDARLLEERDGPSGPQYGMHALVRAYACHAGVSLEALPHDDAALVCSQGG